jgi:hypothetical protein
MAQWPKRLIVIGHRDANVYVGAPAPIGKADDGLGC